ncbi:MAG: hypothetical protein RL021_1077, partial [Bacteroidota bacterium]
EVFVTNQDYQQPIALLRLKIDVECIRLVDSFPYDLLIVLRHGVITKYRQHVGADDGHCRFIFTQSLENPVMPLRIEVFRIAGTEFDFIANLAHVDKVRIDQ